MIGVAATVALLIVWRASPPAPGLPAARTQTANQVKPEVTNAQIDVRVELSGSERIAPTANAPAVAEVARWPGDVVAALAPEPLTIARIAPDPIQAPLSTTILPMGVAALGVAPLEIEPIGSQGGSQ